MNDKFDELAKGLAQSVTRRGALKKFGAALIGIALMAVGLTNRAHADKGGGGHYPCNCKQPDYGCSKRDNPQECFTICAHRCSGGL